MSKLFHFLTERFPIEPIYVAFALLLERKRCRELNKVWFDGMRKEWPSWKQCGPSGRTHSRHLHQQTRAAAFPKPEFDTLRGRLRTMVGVMDFDQAANHGPVFVPLRFLGLDQVWQCHQLNSQPVIVFQRSSTRPQFLKWRDAAHDRHHVDALVFRVGLRAAKMQSVPALQKLPVGRRYRDGGCLEVRQRRAEEVEVRGVQRQCQIGIAAKLHSAV